MGPDTPLWSKQVAHCGMAMLDCTEYVCTRVVCDPLRMFISLLVCVCGANILSRGGGGGMVMVHVKKICKDCVTQNNTYGQQLATLCVSAIVT